MHEMEGWDPRVEDYYDHRSSTVDGLGPLSNFSRSANLARTQDCVREPRGLYVKNVPLSLTAENLEKMFSEHGNVLSVYIGQPNAELAANNITWAIVKVPSMRDSLAMITALNNKPPFHLRVELSMTEEEKKKRREEREKEKQFQQQVEKMTKNYFTDNKPSSSSLSDCSKTRPSHGRGKMMITMAAKLEERKERKKSPPGGLSQSSPKCRQPECVTTLQGKASLPKPVVLNTGYDSVMMKQRKPLPCVFCGASGKMRCSVCKAWYCSKLCQVDDWYSHRMRCSSPPRLETPDNYAVNGGGPETTRSLPSFRSSEVVIAGKAWHRKSTVKGSKLMHFKQEDETYKTPTGPLKMFRKSVSLSPTRQLRRPHSAENFNLMERSNSTNSSGNLHNSPKCSLGIKEDGISTRDTVDAGRSCTNDNLPADTFSPRTDMTLHPITHSNEVSPQTTKDSKMSPAAIEENSMPTGHEQIPLFSVGCWKITSSIYHEKTPACTPLNSVSPSCAQDKTSLSAAQNKTSPSTAQNKTLPSAAQDKISPSVAQDKISPSFAQDKTLPLSAYDKVPFSATQTKVPPSAAQSKTLLSSLEDKLPPSSDENKIPPSNCEDNVSCLAPEEENLLSVSQEKNSPLSQDMPPSAVQEVDTILDDHEQMIPATVRGEVPASFVPQKILPSTFQKILHSSTDEQKHPSPAPTKIPPLTLEENAILSAAQNKITSITAEGDKDDVTEDNLLHSLLQSFPCLSNALKLGGDYEGSITLLESFKQFYAAIFVEGSMDVLCKFHDTLASTPDNGNFKPKIGSLVAALSPTDETWYRGFVYDSSPDGFMVCYIDFGNMEEVTSVKSLPEQFAAVPGLVMVMQLHSVVQPDVQILLEKNIKEESHIFIRVTDKKSEVLKVSLRCENSPSTVVEYIMKPWYTALPCLQASLRNLCDVSFASSPPADRGFDSASFDLSSMPPAFCVLNKDIPVDNVKPSEEISANISSLSGFEETHKVLLPVIPKPVNTVENNVDRLQTASIKISQLPPLIVSEGPEDPSNLCTQNKVPAIVSPSASNAKAHSHKKFWARDLSKTLLTVGEEYMVMPVWIDQENNVYVHLLTEEFSTQYESLVIDVALHSEKSQSVSDLEVGELVCCFVEADNLWYRAEVISPHTDRASVHFIDFGDTKEIPLTRIREFSASLMAYPISCAKVQLVGVRKDNAEAQHKLSTIIESQSVLILISCGDAGVQIFDKERRLINETLMSLPENVSLSQLDQCISIHDCKTRQQNTLTKSSASNVVQVEVEQHTATPNAEVADNFGIGQQPPVYGDFKTSGLPVGQDVDVFVLETVNPFAIFLVSQEFVPLFVNIAQMSDKMDDSCSIQPYHFYRPTLGEICLAKFSEDNKWYRAACVNPGMESAKVFFVDYGNTEDVPHTSIRPISSDFLELPCMAVHCIISGLVTDEMKDEAAARISELLPPSTCKTVTVLHQNEDKTYSIDLPEIREILIAEGLVKSE